ncbi:uncharacterized protein N7506_003389 [Penicillium brevicompactum]|uniref:uncharacterized protein n=1 Tax=Penicillium brevicompactum TaxID=5074 RepID=UPI00254063F6|nr:uncharacterized protein N7506_003389 [Penicillium brevicompactum]KAJ5343565.1 hypothetical protein N7506_003389 [Penicillium brevicompactum]
MNPQRELGGIVGIVVCSVSNILRPSNSVAATVKQSLARHRLSRTRFVSTGLDIFIPYVATSLAGMYFISNLSLPYYMVSKMILGLLLTSVHTAWVHTVISNKDKSVWQRIPSARDWLALIPAASLDITLPDAVYHLTKGTLVYFQDPAQGGELSPTVSFFSAIAPVAFSWLAATVTNAVYTKVAASMLHVNDQAAGSSDHEGPKRQLSVVEAASRITVQDWHRYLGIVYEAVLYEGIWVTFSCIVIATELHYHDPCAVMDLLGWICRDW